MTNRLFSLSCGHVHKNEPNAIRNFTQRFSPKTRCFDPSLGMSMFSFACVHSPTISTFSLLSVSAAGWNATTPRKRKTALWPSRRRLRLQRRRKTPLPRTMKPVLTESQSCLYQAGVFRILVFEVSLEEMPFCCAKAACFSNSLLLDESASYHASLAINSI